MEIKIKYLMKSKVIGKFKIDLIVWKYSKVYKYVIQIIMFKIDLIVWKYGCCI